uniref:Fe2OG dioxygenase domain-containing protein n=1 Tax=Tetraselmis chuii TaxID=63592 RepID=A0A7S1SXU3_9CHLO|mmetsp:Transcript_35408/g.63147  ORF Transcript_35408/g.63147 Transcript_35408/m.63147 type:complete len:275 (+) Transcript_35408:318-1142(+)|eukprot:CAMPEP_0177759914 /NCGR_PEP_ID=MMETSP0491_2-20121128/4986_1 /TAXON_ID=63592 /ORGANISM="Tetraselmis chuii, Strain PLY429" /LENGTH=274 /DNA_ID=CAMNT_0019275775 /DNA_START=290 /DNA_END=1114 /DNA_ORIENTATION=+
MVAIDIKGALQAERRRRAAASSGAALASASSASEEAAAAALQAINHGHERTAISSLDEYRIAGHAAEGLFYIPDFISAEEEVALVRFIDTLPSQRWVAAGERRMLNWGGRPGDLEIREALPGCIQALVARMVGSGVYTEAQAPQHCLVNEYLQGAGIPPHQDGALYAPCVATITLEGRALMDFHPVPDNAPTSQHAGGVDHPVAQVELQPRGLLLMRGDAYNTLLHSIPSQSEDHITELCSNRYSISGVSKGSKLQRSPKRKSLVFVHKILRSS